MLMTNSAVSGSWRGEDSPRQRVPWAAKNDRPTESRTCMCGVQGAEPWGASPQACDN